MLEIEETPVRKASENKSEVEIAPEIRREPRIRPSAVTMSLPTDPPAQIVAEPVKIRAEDTKEPVVHPEVDAQRHVVSVDRFCLHYGKRQALHAIDMKIPAGKVTAMIGPSGCGKSTLLRSVNRLNDLIDHVKVEGNICIDGQPIYARNVDVISLRKRIGMVFQKPNPFPMSIFENVVYSLRIAGEKRKKALLEACEKALRASGLWEEVHNRLHDSALSLSGGQQQRLCIARAIAADPEVLLMDEPCSALDPISTAKIEELMVELKNLTTIVIVTHNMQQAARVSDFTAFLLTGQIIEFSPTPHLFTTPSDPRTEAYITGRFG